MGKRDLKSLQVENKEVWVGFSYKNLIELNPDLFKDNRLSPGGVVKAAGRVLKEQSDSICRPPNMSCRIHYFGRICKKFDVKRTRWVTEMGFGGLLHLVSDMHLPRQLAYWIMTRIDPLNRSIIAPDGRVFSFSNNQVRWILGIPNGSKPVPTSKMMSSDERDKVQHVLMKYGSSWKTKSSRGSGNVYTSIGIQLTTQMMDRLQENFGDEYEEEFKTLFLIVVLHMVLCPTQSPRLGSDLLPALSCAMDWVNYYWCDLVLKKLMDSVSSFKRRFYANGFAGGCGGCAIFAVTDIQYNGMSTLGSRSGP
ncbi:uncharacterized protein LOC110733378 isoform X1 [Chenopodium quinoa]|uniref:uncharacterized protein LOC110733378 isoform X1 n=1 Tax=Chenopodium quinoa TaxID=63459 RepID=UPI000B78230D|nr:uncharacterized protein LOC110733378 isoform X1 [Chenopodium quinoa]